METNAFHTRDDRKLRLQPLPLSSLPAHPLIVPSKTSVPPELRAFATEVLREAVDFADNIIPTTFTAKGKPKPSPPSTARVQMLSTDLLQDEHWVARRSIHADEAAPGTASYDEFVQGLLDEHSVHEQAYTPDCVDARCVMRWFEDGAARDFEEFADVHMELWEMLHKIPFPLQNRVFQVLVVRARTAPGRGFVVAQVPIAVPPDFKEAFYGSGRHVREADSRAKRAKVVVAAYVSAERVRVNDEGLVVWETAVASDARGWLPMSLQKMGIPGAILKDVGLFLAWTNQQRRK